MAGLSNKPPEFFTVFLPEFCSHQLKITSAFKAHLETEVTGEAIIERSATNEVWKVDLVKEGEEFILKNGWKEFVSENDVTIGEFMVFQYRGNSRFTVNIFGTDGIQKLGPGKPTVVLPDENSQDDTDDEDYDDVDDTTKSVGDMTIGKSGTGSMSRNRGSFRVRMTKAYLARNRLHLPGAFTDRYIRGEEVQKVEIRTSEKKWSVDLFGYHANRRSKVYYMFRGEAFADFLSHNDVQPGDVCVYEALDLPGTELSVSVIRTRGH